MRLGDVGDAASQTHRQAEGERAAAVPAAGRYAAPAEEPVAAKKSAPAASLTPTQQKILTAIEGELSIDDLCLRTALPAHSIMAELTLLQIRGHVAARTAGNRFARSCS